MRWALHIMAFTGLILVFAGLAMWSVPLALIAGGLFVFLWACIMFYDKFGANS